MPKERILIIDDKVEISNFLVDLLEPLGYQLTVAMDGREGVSRVLGDGPDLILLDLNMPGMSGIEVLETLHRHDCRSPVILMTLYGSESVAVQAFRLGVRNYVTKPFDINELLVAIEWALEEGRLRRERERLVAELSQTNQKLTQRMQELSVLQAVGRSVASLMPKEQLVRRILDAASYVIGAQVSALFLQDRQRGGLYLAAIHGGERYHSGLQSDARDSHAEDVLRSGQPKWVAQPSKRTGVTGYLGAQAASLLYVPIRLGEEVIGVLGSACPCRERALLTELQSRLTTLADYAAIALTNAQLYEDLQQHAQRLAAINQIAQTIASSLDLQEIMHIVVRSIKHSLSAEAATLVLRDEASEELVFEIVLGNGLADQGPFRIQVSQGIVGWVVQQGESLRVNDVSQDPRFCDDIDRISGFRTRSILCVPLTISDRVIGAIEAINKGSAGLPEGSRQFTAADEALLRGAAAFVAIAVENARLHAATRETVAAQTLQDTVVTLSHHINNPLQALVGVAELLKTDLGSHPTVAKATSLLEAKVREISIVLALLREIGLPQSTVYLGSIQMLDIEHELQTRLKSV